jgi:hypothetical protein
MLIKLEDINNSGSKELFIGPRKRLATCTSVKLLSHRRLVACSLVGQRMYLIRFDLDSGHYGIESCIPTRFDGKDVCTDLLDFDGKDRFVTSNCREGSVTVYRLTDSGLKHEKDITIPAGRSTFCHGARFVPPDGSMICATTTDEAPFAYFISVVTGEVAYKLGEGEWRVKDVCFLGDGGMIALYAEGTPRTHAATGYNSKLSLIAIDLDAKRHEILDEQMLAGHTDCCHYLRGKVYISNASNDSVTVFRVEDDRMVYDREVEGFDFPHGLDVLPDPDLLAVTNYASNTIALRPL